MTKVVLGKDTVVHGKLSSDTLDVNDRLIVNGDDIIVKARIQGTIKEFTMSKIIEAIMALNERTCMMYPDYDHIKVSDAIIDIDGDKNLLPDLLTGLTIEIIRDSEVLYSFSIAESSISGKLTRGMMLTSTDIDTIMTMLKQKSPPGEYTFISPVIYEETEPGKVTLKSFSLQGQYDILPESDGLYKYTVIDDAMRFAVSITGDSNVYNSDFTKAFITSEEETSKGRIPILYPIPPLFDGIIYDGKEYKRLNVAFEEKSKDKRYSRIGLQPVFDLNYDYYNSRQIKDGIIDITKWDLKDDMHFIVQYFVRAHEDIISKVRYDKNWYDKLGHGGFEIIERPVYTVQLTIPGNIDPITIAKNVELITEYGFEVNKPLSEENMDMIKAAVEKALSGQSINILISDIVQEYDYKDNILTLVAAINDTASRATEEGPLKKYFTDTRTNKYGTLYTYTLNGTVITVKRIDAQTMLADYGLGGTYSDTISLISPITNAIYYNGNEVAETYPTFVLNELFSNMTIDASIRTADISHWKLDAVNSAANMFMGCSKDINVEYGTNFSDKFISKFANELYIRLISRDGDEENKRAITTDAYSFSINSSLTSSEIDVCKSVITDWLVSKDYGDKVYSYTETVPYLISDDKAYVRSFFDTILTAAYIDSYTYDMTTETNRPNSIVMSVKADENISISTPPLMEPVYMYRNETGFVGGNLTVDYSKLAAGSKLNGEVDISHWSLCGVTSLNGAFSDCISMTTLKCNHKDSASLNYCDMDALCSGCASLEKIELTSLPFNIMSVDNAFAGCESLSEVIISGVTLDVNSLNGLFNGCSYNGGVDVRIYTKGSEGQQVKSFTDTFTNVTSMQIKTNNENLFSEERVNHLRWYYDDGTDHGYTTCENDSNSNTIKIGSCESTSRFESVVPIICSGTDAFKIASSSIGPNVDYPGEDITIENIVFANVISDTLSTFSCSSALSYISDILPNINAFESTLISALNNEYSENGFIVETLPDHYQTVLNKTETITLRYCPVDGNESDNTNPYKYTNSKFVFDYSYMSDAFDPPFRRPMLITKTDGISELTLSEPSEINNEAIKNVLPINHKIADYTHWDTMTYLTTSVIEQTFGSSYGEDPVTTIIAPHVNSAILTEIEKVIGARNGGTLNLYTYTDIDNLYNTQNIDESDESVKPKYDDIVECPSKINGMQGYSIVIEKTIL